MVGDEFRIPVQESKRLVALAPHFSNGSAIETEASLHVGHSSNSCSVLGMRERSHCPTRHTYGDRQVRDCLMVVTLSLSLFKRLRSSSAASLPFLVTTQLFKNAKSAAHIFWAWLSVPYGTKSRRRRRRSCSLWMLILISLASGVSRTRHQGPHIFIPKFIHTYNLHIVAPLLLLLLFIRREEQRKKAKKKTRPAKSLQFTSGMENDVYKLSGLPPTPFLSLASSTMARAVLLLPLTPLCRQAFNRQQNVMFPPLFCIFFFKHKNNKSTI